MTGGHVQEATGERKKEEADWINSVFCFVLGFCFFFGCVFFGGGAVFVQHMEYYGNTASVSI